MTTTLIHELAECLSTLSAEDKRKFPNYLQGAYQDREYGPRNAKSFISLAVDALIDDIINNFSFSRKMPILGATQKDSLIMVATGINLYGYDIPVHPPMNFTSRSDGKTSYGICGFTKSRTMMIWSDMVEMIEHYTVGEWCLFQNGIWVTQKDDAIALTASSLSDDWGKDQIY